MTRVPRHKEESMRQLRRRATRVAGALCCAAILFSAAGCSPGDGQTSQQPKHTDEIHLYGTDGNMLNGIGARLTDYPNGLAGMKGTAPLTRLSRTFKDRLRTVDSSLKDDQYAGESYDAVVIAALAAQIARSTSPRAIASQIVGVTEGGTICQSLTDCLSLIRQGKDIAYRGVSVRLGGFTDAGEPSAAMYGILRFASNNQLDPDQTEFVPAGDAGTAATTAAPAPAGGSSDGPLKIGALLPHTGALAEAGPPLFAGAELAVKEINNAGGILGRPIQWFDGDDFTDKGKAIQTVQRLIGEGVQVIIGAGASSITAAVLPTVVKAGVVLFSPCNTAAALSTVDDQGLYFRTAPPDGLQATALTDIIMRDGVRRITIVSRHDSYGDGLMNAVKDKLRQAGLADADIKVISYSPDKPDFSSLGNDIKAYAPDGVLIIGFDESTEAIDSILKAGLKSRTV
jgi:ABC-type branched-subunit amino acid transport system substrate-binding protein